MIIDFILSILEKLFNVLKKKSRSTYWKNMEILSVKQLKITLLKQLLAQKEIQDNLTKEQILQLKIKIYNDENLGEVTENGD